MKAIELTENQKLEIKEREIPQPEADECLVKVKACGVCSSDIYRGFDAGAYFYPLVMGHEFSGTIVENGANCTRGLEKGQLVSVFPLLPCFKCTACEAKKYAQCHEYSYYGSRQDGAYAEYICVKEWNLVPLDSTVDPRNAAAMEPISVVVHALESFPKTAKRVAILGAGFLGLIALKIKNYLEHGYEVTVLDRNQYKLDMAKELGAEVQLLSEASDYYKFSSENEGAFDVVLESCGAPTTFEVSTQLCARSGTVVWMGNISGDLTLPRKLVSSILRKEITIKGVWNSTYWISESADQKNENNKSDWGAAAHLLDKGLDIRDLLTHEVDFEGVPEVLKQLYDHKMRVERHDILKAIVVTDG